MGGEEREGRDDGSSALRVIVLDHDAPEDFGGVEVFEVFGAASGFVGSEASRSVLHGEESVDSVADTLVGDENGVAWDPLEEDYGFETFTGAIAYGISLFSSTECPSSLSLLTVANVLLLAVFSDLLVFKEFQSFGQHGFPSRIFCQVGFDDGLDEESGVPGLDPIGTVHKYAFVFHP